MTHKNEESVAHKAADVVDRAVHAVEEKYEEAGRFARDSVKHGRDKVVDWKESLEECIGENPKASLLIAAALGALVATWFKRR